MSKTNLPYMPLWVYDLEADEDCSVMSLEEFGALIRLLQRQWIKGSIPADLARITRLLRVTACEMERIWPVLEPKFVKDGRGRLINRRLDEERSKGYKPLCWGGAETGAARRCRRAHRGTEPKEKPH